MFSFSMLAVVTGLAATTSTPEWQPSYRSALSQAATQHKSVVVFIANGGVDQAVAGSIPAEAASLLKLGYVCVSVDTATPQGAQVAESFGMNQGVVISDRNGQHQALRYQGAIAPEQLAENLRRLQSVDTASTTERVNADAISDAPAVTTTPYTMYAPAMSYAPTYVPTMGGCASGNCGGISYVQPTYMSSGCASGNCGMGRNYAPMTFGGCANGQCFR